MFSVLTYADNPGNLDVSFGGTGIVTTSITTGRDHGYAVAIQSDNKIVVVGSANHKGLAVVRYTITGELDTTFNGTGIVTTPISTQTDFARSVAIQSDDKIVVSGGSNGLAAGDHFTITIARYTITGTLDTTFNNTGIVTTPLGKGSSIDSAFPVAVQDDGKIIIACGIDTSNTASSDYKFAVVRYTITGSLDTTFNDTGIVTTSIGAGNDDNPLAIAIQSDGKIIVAGNSSDGFNYDFALVRYTVTGSLDSTFNGTGIVTTSIDANNPDWAQAVAIGPDGKIVIAGHSNANFAAIRFNDDGSPDTGFNGTSIVTTPIGTDAYGAAVAIQYDKKVIVAGNSNSGDLINRNSDIAVVRYNDDGSLDNSFNNTGIITTSLGEGYDAAYSLVLQSDGKLVAAGEKCDGQYCVFAVVRYLGDPNLHLNKTVNNPFPNPNQLITYTITLSNSGSFSATNVIISDTLPDGVTLAGPVVLTPPEAGITGTPPILVHSLTVGVDQLITVTIPVTVDNNLIDGTIITNTAVVTNIETSPITASTTITIGSNPVITITKTANVETANVGETITYTYQITNTGNVSLTNIIATDTPLGIIPLNTNYLTPNQATTGILTYTIVEADLPGPLTNIAVVTGTFQTREITVTTNASVALLKSSTDNYQYLPVILKND